MASEKKPKMDTNEVRRLLQNIDKLGDFIDGKVTEVPKEKPKEEPKKLAEDELMRRKEEIRQLLNVLDEEYRESVISEKTYNEARNRSKEELLRIQKELEGPDSGEPKDEKVSRIVELERSRIELENKIKTLTEAFARAEITRENYSKEINGVKQNLDKVRAEIMRLDKGATIAEVRLEEKKPEKTEKTVVIRSRLQSGVTDDEK